MGIYIRCGSCGTEVYTTVDRFPGHESPEGQRCRYKHGAQPPERYTEDLDTDLNAYPTITW